MITEKRNSELDNVDEDINPEQIVKQVKENWKFFLITLLVCVALAYAFLRYTVPQYKVYAKLLVDDKQNGAASIFSSGSSLSSTFSDLFDVQSNVDNEAEILKTGDLLARVVNVLNLNIIYLNEGRVNTLELYHRNPYKVTLLNFADSLEDGKFEVQFKDSTQFRILNKHLKLDQTYGYGDTIKSGGGKFVITRTNLKFEDFKYAFRLFSVDAVVADLKKSQDVQRTGKTLSTIDLEIKSNLQQKGEDILSTLIQEYLNINVQEKNKFADSTISFIDNRLKVVSLELEDRENSVQDFKKANNIANLDAQSKAIVTSSSDYYNQLSTLEVQASVVKAMLEYIDDRKNIARPVPSLTGTPDPIFGGLIERYNTLLAQRDRLLLNSTERNPYVANLDEQIKNVRQDLFNNLQNQQKNIEIAKEKMVSQNNTIAQTIKKVPVQERQFLDLSRQQDIKQALYLYLLQKKEEVEVSRASTIAGARLIDHPKADVKPYSPNKYIILGSGLLLGLILPFGILYFKKILNTKVTSQQDIDKVTNIPILAEIGHNTTDERIVMVEDSRSPLSEQFRALRTNLQFFLSGEKNKTILLTSSMPGEGKSFTALNISMALALSGKKVMLIELDLRKPSLSPDIKTSKKVGFTNFIISGNLKPEDIFVNSGLNENLDFISSGPIPPNPSELILNSRVEVLIEYLNSNYDYVILDAPPIGVVTDAQLLSKYADLTIYVVRQNYTFKNQLGIVKDLHVNQKMKRLVLLVNDAVFSKTSAYGYYYGYGYGVTPEKKKRRTKQKTN